MFACKVEIEINDREGERSLKSTPFQKRATFNVKDNSAQSILPSDRKEDKRVKVQLRSEQVRENRRAEERKRSK